MIPDNTAQQLAQQLPDEITQLPQWVAWRYEARESDGRQTKMPYSPITNLAASSIDPATWATFAQAYEFWRRRRLDGVGFVFAAGGGITGIDLDHCVHNGVPELWALELVNSLDSYTELSPSGEGLHILVAGALPAGSRHQYRPPDASHPDAKVELYDSGRYFTVTGRRFPNTPRVVNDCQSVLDDIHSGVLSTPDSPGVGDSAASAAPVALDDDELLRLAARGKHGVDFDRLWRGDWRGNPDWPSQSEADQALCNALAFWTGRDARRMDALFRQSGLMRSKWDRRIGGDRYGQRTIDKAIAGCHAVYDGESHALPVVDMSELGFTGDQDTAPAAAGAPAQQGIGAPAARAGVPQINTANLDLRVISAETWDALARANASNPRLFRHGGAMMRLQDGDDGLPALKDLTPDVLRYELARAAEFYLAGKGRRQVTLPPVHVVRDLLATPTPPLPILSRIVEAPVFGADGSVEVGVGYHAGSATYCAPPKQIVVPPVSAAPSNDEVDLAKLLLLEDLWGDFALVSDADRAHVLALGLLPFVRNLIDGPTPLHLVEAPMPGSGKGLLVEMTLRPSCGANFSMIAQASDDDEWRKRITACLRDGKAAILIDNATRSIDSGSLAMALTATHWTDRVLGLSSTINLPIRVVWVATANNPVLSAEIARRSIRARIDQHVERPWEQSGWRHENIREWVDENRGQLAWAFLTLAQAWLAAGRPPYNGPLLGSYESWSRVLGGILQHAGVRGFLENVSELYDATDNETAAWQTFVAEWLDAFGANEVGVNDLYPLTVDIDGLYFSGGTEKARRTAFGVALAKQKDRVIDGQQIAKCRTRQRLTQWRLTPVNPVAASSQWPLPLPLTQ